MAIAFVDKSSAVNSANALAIPVPAAAATDNFLIAVLASKTPTITPPSGWTQLDLVSSSLTTLRTVAFWKKAAAGDLGTSPSWTLAGNNQTVGVMVAYSGQDLSTPVESHALTDNGAPSTSASCGSATVAVNNELHILICGARPSSNASPTYTAPSGYTIREQISPVIAAQQNVAAVVADQIVPAGSTGTQSFTLSTASWNQGGYVVLALPAAPTPHTGKMKTWDGSAWQSHPAKTWDGSAWQTHPVKVWDGSSWTLAK